VSATIDAAFCICVQRTTSKSSRYFSEQGRSSADTPHQATRNSVSLKAAASGRSSASMTMVSHHRIRHSSLPACSRPQCAATQHLPASRFLVGLLSQVHTMPVSSCIFDSAHAAASTHPDFHRSFASGVMIYLELAGTACIDIASLGSTIFHGICRSLSSTQISSLNCLLQLAVSLIHYPLRSCVRPIPL
jgi:hypothetical protein